MTWLSPARSVALLRVAVSMLLMAHAAVRVIQGTIPQFSQFLEAKGLPWPTALVWAITALELGGGVLLIAGRFQRVLSVAFFLMLAVGIVLIHAPLGWFVGEHGTGGMEYSVALMVALMVVYAHAPGQARG